MRKLTAIWRNLPPFYNKKEDVNLPWVQTWKGIDQRCKYKHGYSKKGIKNLINPFELKRLWFRDKAYLMEWPSIDRKNNSESYKFSNCQYLEYKENCKKRDLIPAYRKKMSDKMKRQWKDSNLRELSIKGTKNAWKNPKFRKVQSDVRKEYWKNKEYRRIHSEFTSKQLKKLWKNPLFREKKSKDAKKQWKENNFGRYSKKEKK